MVRRYRREKKEKRQRFVEQLRNIHKENTMQNKYSSEINRSSVNSDDSYMRAASIYEATKLATFNTDATGGSDEDDDANLDLNDLTFADKAQLFNYWTFFIMFGDVLQVVGSIFLSINTSTTVNQAEGMLGFGAFVSWASLIKYAENYKGYNIITNTIINSFPILIKAVIGILPLLIGTSMLAL